MKSRIPEFKNRVLDNGSYKFVALLAALILWLMVLGRKDTITSKDVRVEFLLNPKVAMASNDTDWVTVKVKGPRLALKKFNQAEEPIVLNLNFNDSGSYRLKIDEKGTIDLPLGVKLLSIRPNILRVTLVEKEEEN